MCRMLKYALWVSVHLIHSSPHPSEGLLRCGGVLGELVNFSTPTVFMLAPRQTVAEIKRPYWSFSWLTAVSKRLTSSLGPLRIGVT